MFYKIIANVLLYGLRLLRSSYIFNVVLKNSSTESDSWTNWLLKAKAAKFCRVSMK
jgi:hypothetical protein